MFKWLLRRRAHKIALRREPSLTLEQREFYQDGWRMFSSELKDRGVTVVGGTIGVLRLDREDHYTCVKCGHTHIVTKGE